MTASNPIVQPGSASRIQGSAPSAMESPITNAVGGSLAPSRGRRSQRSTVSPRATMSVFVVARYAVHLDVAAVAERERARRQRIQRRRPPFADEPLRLARPGADLDHDRLVGGASEPHELLGWHASVVAEQHQRARRRQLAGHGAAGGPERRRRLRRGLRRGHARRDRTGDGAEREHGRERASHVTTVSSGTQEPGPSPGCGGCGAPFAPRARPEPVGVRERPGQTRSIIADVVLETVARRVERVRRPSERRGHGPQRPSRHPSRPGRRRGTLAAGDLGRPTELVLTHPMFVRPELWGLDHLALTSSRRVLAVARRDNLT